MTSHSEKLVITYRKTEGDKLKIMINVTERARQELYKLLIANVDWTYACLRILDRGQGNLGLGVDIETPGDYVMEYQGRKFLVVEPQIADSLTEITIDVDDTPAGPEIVISEEPVTTAVYSLKE